ncbi:MAG: hypothetical protein QOH62_3322 [Solirubrobacteraceae bacterium]|jgi:hypothetical protein|nr:hypothetical protein [Solirubrobacteraceae bacterium]
MPPTHRLFAPFIALLIVLMALVAALALPAPPADASDDQLSIMMDDDQLLYRGDQVRDASLKKMAAAGVDMVRVTVLWSVVANGAKRTPAARRRFNKLGAANPKAYPKLNWDRYDRLVRSTRQLGIVVYFDVTPPGPSWGHARAPRSERANQRTWKPKPSEFYKFVRAVGKRFDGTYKDENDKHARIPRVYVWSLGNEPNQGGWLTPQWEHGKLASPRLYRSLYFAGRRALNETGHGPDAVFIGETAPLGSSKRSSRSPVRPKTFIRQLLCAPGHTDSGCSDFEKFGPLQATAWAHHPYTKKLSPLQRDANADSITMANLNELPDLLDTLSTQTAHIATGLPVISTEFGYETNPPDKYSGIPLEKQADYLTLGDYLTYANPRVIGNTQFLLRDVPPLSKYSKTSRHYWFTYQSGLLTRSGKPKPSAQAYVFPFLAQPTGTPLTSSIWGQLRFRPNNLPEGAQDQVQIEFKPADGSADWSALGAPITVTNARGFFTGQVTVPAPGSLRAVWSPNAAPPYYAISRGYPVS